MESEKNVGLETMKKPVIGPKRRKLVAPKRRQPVDPKMRSRKVSACWGLSVTAVAPLRRLEILLQVQNSQNMKYKNIIQGLQHMRRTDGFRGLFKGNGAYMVHALSSSAVQLVVSNQLTRIIQLYQQQPGKKNATITSLLTLGIPAWSQMIATPATYPMDVVRGRLSVQTGKSPYHYRGISHALSTIAREEGPRALYKGCLPFTIGQVVSLYLNVFVYGSLYISATKDMRRKLIEAQQVSDYTELKPEDIKPEMLLATRKKLPYYSVFASVVGLTFAYPFNVIHRRMQMGNWTKSSPIIAYDGNNKAAVEFTGMCDAFRKTIRNDGYKALYRGYVPNLLVKVFPTSLVASVIHRRVMEGLGFEGVKKGPLPSDVLVQTEIYPEHKYKANFKPTAKL